MKSLALLLFASAAFAQHGEWERWEIGADVGYGFYHNGTIYSPNETLTAGIRNRFAAGFTFGEETYNYLSGEFQYLYQDGHPFLEGPGFKTDIQGQSHTLTYSLLVHFTKRDRRFRPFVEGGIGGKGYIIAGPEPFPQPAPLVATLSDHDVWKVVFEAGGGFTYRPAHHMLLRAEFRDYMTGFPRQQIIPAVHNTARGIFHQFTPLFGVSYAF